LGAFDHIGFVLFSLAVLAAAALSVWFSDHLPIDTFLAFAHFFFFASIALSIWFGRLSLFYALIPIWVIVAALTNSFGLADRLEPKSIDLLRLAAWYIAPLNFAVFAWLEERSFFSFRSFTRALAVALELGIIALIAFGKYAPEALCALSTPLFSPPQALENVPQIALIFCAAAVLSLIAKICVERQNTLDVAMFFAFIGVIVSLFLCPNRAAQTVFFLALALIIATGFARFAYRLAYYDELTGLLGRRALFETLRKLSGRYAVAMIDIDHFKLFNDEYGHDTGDQALKMVAAKLALTRGGAKTYRYGGEEFAIVFNGKNKKEAAPYLEETRAMVEEARFIKRSPKRPKAKLKDYRKVRGKNGDGEHIVVTVSVGASDSENALTPLDVIKSADKALYRAKEQGRNRVVM
jgi:diguanylate cyclase (GGDEF)-like protein